MLLMRALRANVDDDVKDTIINVLGVRVASNPEKYLGLPMMIDAISVYVMQCFALPKFLCCKLEGLMNNARDLIEDRILWQLGNGANVNIWNDPWLLGVETTEYQLIEAETNTWNKELVRNIVDDVHVTHILSILLSKARSEDTLVWKHKGSGEYLVKNGYRFLITEHFLNTNYINPNTMVYKDFYRSFWAMHIPAKVKIHVWRPLNNFLPNYCNLNQRKLRVRVDCPLCKAAPEDTDHLLWSCGTLQSVWASLQIKIAPTDKALSCKNYFVNTFCLADELNRQLIAISLWALWYRRNKLIHEGINFSLQELLGFIQGYRHEINLCQEKIEVACVSRLNEVWRPPDLGFIKLNFDATFQSESKTSSIAVLARDCEREVVGAETYLFTDVVDVFVAEARVCERTLPYLYDGKTI
ncbi:hypothetical protein J1N35_026471 [Gossypium stocksii]|uniref:Reverse transcriptase zinc-binding domain-containing protein n=1 Tax=Gossypium stocksii TaxID=47602 RepID=A0A9D3VAP4_9ROSI|nr:hypothetical protein J1N35_026471 [Gossypium stocksii]